MSVPFWKQTFAESMYSSVGLISSPTLLDSATFDVRFAAATWLNEPKMVEVFSSDSKKWFCRVELSAGDS